MDELQSIVDMMLPRIEEKLNTAPSSFRLWFGDLKLISLTDQKAVFTTPTPLRAKILSGKYISVMHETLTEAVGFDVEIEIRSLTSESISDPSEEEEPPEESAEDYKEKLDREQRIRETISGETNGGRVNVLDSYTFENFIEGASNRFAKAACLAVAKDPAKDYNPLFIHGHSGLGKTHLLCAIIHYIKRHRPDLKIVYKRSEDFINELVYSLSVNATAAFKERYRSADVLLIDDIQFIAGKESMQEEFFHTFSTLYESGKQIILTSDRPPNEIKPLEDRLRTRFEGGLIADIQPPSQELRAAIIRSKSEAMGLVIPSDLIDYIAERLHDNIRQLEGVLAKIHAYTMLTHQPLSKEAIDQAISMVDPGNIPVDVLIDRILHETGNYYGIAVEALKSKKKTDNIAKARHIAIYIIRKMTDKSLKEIGEIFGRDHTTIMASCNKVEIDIKTMKNTESDIKKIIRSVKG